MVFSVKFREIENTFSIHLFLTAKSIPESLQALRNNLAVDSACRNLVFADMYNALDLKQEAIRFIVYNISNVIQVSPLDIELFPKTLTTLFNPIGQVQLVLIRNNAGNDEKFPNPSKKTSRSPLKFGAKRARTPMRNVCYLFFSRAIEETEERRKHSFCIGERSF